MRRTLVLVLVLVACAAVAGGRAGAATVTTRAIPACPASTPGGAFPHPNCLLARWVDSSYSEPFTGTVRLVKQRSLEKGLFVEIVLKATYASGFERTCPNPTPSDMIPCHSPTVGLGVLGKYVKGAKTLTPVIGSVVTTGSCPDGSTGPCCSPTTCTMRFRMNASSEYGRVVLVVQARQGTVTKNPKNSLGAAGFEVPIAVTVPRFKG